MTNHMSRRGKCIKKENDFHLKNIGQIDPQQLFYNNYMLGRYLYKLYFYSKALYSKFAFGDHNFQSGLYGR